MYTFIKTKRKRHTYQVKPFLISKWLEEYREFGKSFFFTMRIYLIFYDFDSLLEDNISYLSDTIGYIGYKYIMDCCDRYEKQYPKSEKRSIIKRNGEVVGLDVDLIEKIKKTLVVVNIL